MKKKISRVLLAVFIMSVATQASAGWFTKYFVEPVKAVVEVVNQLADDLIVEPADLVLDAALDNVEANSNSGDILSAIGDAVVFIPFSQIVVKSIGDGGYSDSGGLDFSIPAAPAGNTGTINVATFNVHGLPVDVEGIPDEKAAELSLLIEAWDWDILGLQEDFVIHDALMSGITTGTYPYRSQHYAGTRHSLGDGLLTLSKFPFDNVQETRVEWSECDGALTQLLTIVNFINGGGDSCLSEKGFSVSEVYIANDFVVHFYNLHRNTSGDEEAILSNLDDLRTYINSYSVGYPVIVAGDFNLRFTNGLANTHLTTWLNDTGLTFTCIVLDPAQSPINGCGTKIDMIAYKGNSQFSFGTLSETEHDDLGISDHRPRSAVLSWSR